MAEVTVTQLAESVGTPVERLLTQMKEAGLAHSAADEIVSDADKKSLLKHLQSSHGAAADAKPKKKITLKRKTTSTLKSAGKKTVNVEVRKKRAVNKPGEEAVEAAAELSEKEQQAQVAAEQAAAEARLAKDSEKAKKDAEEVKAAEAAKAKAEAEELEARQAAAIAAAQAAAEEAAAKAVEELAHAAADAARKEKEELEAKAKADPSDPEVMRQLAQAKRREKVKIDEEERAVKQKARAEEKRLAEAAAEKRRQELAAEAAKQRANDVKDKSSDSDSSTVSKKEKKASRPKRLKDAPAAGKEHEKKKLGMRGGKEGKTRGKGRGHNLKGRLDGNYEERSRHRKGKRINVETQAFEAPTEKQIIEVEVGESTSVSNLASQMNVKAGELIKVLMGMGVMATVNQSLDQDTATLAVEEMGHTVKTVSETELEDALLDALKAELGTQEYRAPVVTVMGHVDHGKTSLLDYIRQAHVAGGEAGGITQHIGAYHVDTEKGMVTFLDTPGHAAFTAMRARGAQATDIVVLVVAADDGVMPQTEEAVQHAKAAGVPLVVAVNKCDKEGADPDRVKNELAAKEVIPEDWGGDTQFIEVSAHTGQGIDELLESLILQSELLELTAATDIPAKGVVIESRMEKGRGVVTSLLIQNGVLEPGQIVLAGDTFGKVRAMIDENGQPCQEAGPSIPVEILGLSSAPGAGDEFFVVESEKKAREVAEFRNDRDRSARLARQQTAKLENMFENMTSADKQILNIVLKTDVRGSLEALTSSLQQIGNDEVAVNIVSSGVGGISETDASLALTSGAVIFGFNVRAEGSARKLIEKEGLDLRYYSVIYDILDDVTAALSGMLSPEVREEIVGVAEVKEVFTSPKFGLIAGSIVIEGTIHHNKPIRVLRDDVVIYEGELESLRRFKDDVAKVPSGTECGIGVKDYKDVKAGDKIEVFDVNEVARSL